MIALTIVAVLCSSNRILECNIFDAAECFCRTSVDRVLIGRNGGTGCPQPAVACVLVESHFGRNDGTRAGENVAIDVVLPLPSPASDGRYIVLGFDEGEGYGAAYELDESGGFSAPASDEAAVIEVCAEVGTLSAEFGAAALVQGLGTCTEILHDELVLPVEDCRGRGDESCAGGNHTRSLWAVVLIAKLIGRSRRRRVGPLH